jgi:predicted  nucleic acid-binding Zn-ribbon protein
MSRHRSLQTRLAATTVATLILVALAAVLPLASTAQPSLDQLRGRLSGQQAQEQSLSASVQRLSQLIAGLDSQIALVQSREAAVRAELAVDRKALAAAQQALARERELLRKLTARLARAREGLARQLVSSYESDKPDIVTTVLQARGFADLLERVDFLKRAQQQQQTVITITRIAKAQADAAAHRLAKLEANDRRITQDAALRAAALAGMDRLLQSKQAAVQQARAEKAAALRATRAQSSQIQSQISKLEAQQATAFAGPGSGALGPGGGWAIPYSIVLCESGGQNLPPNSAGASGYYQIIPSTWSSFGGTGPAAYLTSKAEQDAVATRIWNNGAGIGNWDRPLRAALPVATGRAAPRACADAAGRVS